MAYTSQGQRLCTYGGYPFITSEWDIEEDDNMTVNVDVSMCHRL